MCMCVSQIQHVYSCLIYGYNTCKCCSSLACCIHDIVHIMRLYIYTAGCFWMAIIHTLYIDNHYHMLQEICNLEREYRDCIKSRRDKIGITRCTKCYIMCMSPSSLGNCTIYSTWCIMICLVIPILSLLLFIQSLYSLSKLQIFSFTCLLSFFCCFYK